MKDEPTINHEKAAELMRETFRQGNERVTAFVQEMAGWDALPKKFDVSGDGWTKAEEEITAAANRGDWLKVSELGAAYLARIDNFLNGWRAQLTKQAA